MSETCCTRLAENSGRKKSRQKSPSEHHRTTSSGYIFAIKARIDNRKKLIKQQYVLHMSPQNGELRPTIGWDRLTSWGHPCKFQLVSRLGSVTIRHLVVGVSQTLRRWTEGASYIRKGDHHVGHWPTFLVQTVGVNFSEASGQGMIDKIGRWSESEFSINTHTAFD